ncbi:MAG TPA: hypothetical protein PKO06_24595 [Candidatus Ozemobacteraceae bacterium]|nr:hypothetical protein [Candidatus Ozemobacteraceae bacterium]
MTMRRWVLMVLVCVGACQGMVFGQAIEAPFVLWMANNEARSMMLLAQDRQLLDRMSCPLGLLTLREMPGVRVEEALWAQHATMYRMLPEVSEVFRLARRFGSGAFMRVVEQARPGYATVQAFFAGPGNMGRTLAPILDKRFQEDFLTAVGLPKDSEQDLSKRLEQVLRSVRDSERRLLEQYLDNFLALYPKNRPTRYLASLVKNGLNREFAKGMTQMVNEVNQAVAASPEPADAASGGDKPPAGDAVATGTEPAGEDPFAIFK